MGSFPGDLMKDGTFVTRCAGKGPREEASLIGLAQAAGTWTKLCLTKLANLLETSFEFAALRHGCHFHFYLGRGPT